MISSQSSRSGLRISLPTIPLSSDVPGHIGVGVHGSYIFASFSVTSSKSSSNWQEKKWSYSRQFNLRNGTSPNSLVRSTEAFLKIWSNTTMLYKRNNSSPPLKSFSHSNKSTWFAKATWGVWSIPWSRWAAILGQSKSCSAPSREWSMVNLRCLYRYRTSWLSWSRVATRNFSSTFPSKPISETPAQQRAKGLTWLNIHPSSPRPVIITWQQIHLGWSRRVELRLNGLANFTSRCRNKAEL